MLEQKSKPKDDLQFEELQPYIRVINSYLIELSEKTCISINVLKYHLYAVFIVTKFYLEYSCINITSTFFIRKR